MESTAQDGVQLLKHAQDFLLKSKFYLPFRNETFSVVALNRPLSKLDIFIQEVATGYLGLPIYQEISVNVLNDNPVKAAAVYEKYRDGYLVITGADSLEEKVLNFCQVCFVVDVVVIKLLLASQKWPEILEFCRQNKNQFLISGTIINDKYVHHLDIPKIDVFVCIPQFLDDTNAPLEMDAGKQLFKKKQPLKKKLP